MTAINNLASNFIQPMTQIGSYERNEKAFGPVTASVIGLVDAASTAAESTYTFSDEALSKLSATIGSGVHSVTEAIGDTAEAIGNAAHSAYDAVSHTVASVGDAASSVVHAVEDVGSEVVDGIGDALGHAGAYAAYVGQTIGNAVDLTA